MFEGWRIAGRSVAVLVALAAFAGFDVTAAFAQSTTCAQLNASLQSLNRNSDFRNADQTNGDAQALQANERNAESAYIRGGCQRDQQVGNPQTPECRQLARQILQSRAQLQQLSQSIANGNGIAQQREEVLQEIARFGCNQRNSDARFSDDSGDQPQRRPRNFLEELFGGPSQQDAYGDTYSGQENVEDPYANEQTGNTIRTVCVRMSDGYYWPISYATVPDYIPQDAQTCQSECPGQQVDLYFYDNPGQEPEQMVNADGQAYASLATAFAYRTTFDLNNTCRPRQTFGQITLDDIGNGRTRAVITYNGDKFPLPLRDPRRTENATTLPAKYAQIVDIPLPRPRPSSAASAPAVLPTSEPVVSARNRTVKVGDKIVRVVGPDTPYAPATTSGTGDSS